MTAAKKLPGIVPVRSSRALRLQLGIDDYSWRQFRALSDEDQNAILLWLELHADLFETHPERWGPSLCHLARGYREAERYMERVIDSLSAGPPQEEP